MGVIRGICRLLVNMVLLGAICLIVVFGLLAVDALINTFF